MAQSLRELVATFGIRFDPTGAKKASHALDNLGRQAKGEVAGTMVQSAKAATAQTNVLGNALKTVGLLFAAQQVARGFGYIVSSASDADETMNVLQASFGDATQSVLDFANKTAAEVGRSEFVLRDFAGRIGALVSPAFAGMGDAGEEQTARISSDFSKLAIDLASFFNKTEEEAITALRSGVSGESEPLKQFGVDLTEAGMADALGINKKEFAKMDRAQKMLARHQAIMIMTQNAQGDAARTADGFANASRAVGSAILDTATSIGRKILPAVETMTRHVRDGIRWFGNLVKGTHLVESALTTAAAAAVWFGGRAIWAARRTVMAWAAALWPFALAIVVIDEVWTTLAGGESILRDLLVWFLGSEKAADEFLSAVKNGAVEAWDAISSGASVAWERIKQFFQAWMDGFEEIWPIIQNLFSDALAAWEPVFDWLGDVFGGIVDTWMSTVGAFYGWLWDGFKSVFSKVGELALGIIPDSVRDFFKGAGEGISNMAGAIATGATLDPEARLNASIGAGNTSNMSQNVTVNVNGGTGGARDTGREVERGVRRALSEDRRKVTNSVGG